MDITSVEKKLNSWKNIKFYFPYKELTGAPKWGTAVLTCMDCRIVSDAFGISDPGEITIIRNAGGLLTYDSLRSILIAIYGLNVNKIVVCGHTNCGGKMNRQEMEQLVTNISERSNVTYKDVLEMLGSRDPSKAILGFVDVNKRVQKTVNLIKNHPLISPMEIQVVGYVYDTKTGEFNKIC